MRPGTIGFGLASHWLRKWRELCQPITERSKAKVILEVLHFNFRSNQLEQKLPFVPFAQNFHFHFVVSLRHHVLQFCDQPIRLHVWNDRNFPKFHFSRRNGLLLNTAPQRRTKILLFSIFQVKRKPGLRLIE